MSRIIEGGFGEINLGTLREPEAVELEPGAPFHILLAGDFSGAGLPARAPVAIDRDNFDAVMAAMNVAVDLRGLKLQFRELDDFHPDRIYRSAPIFQNLDRGQPAPPPPAPTPTAGLLDQMLAEKTADRPVSLQDAGDIEWFARRVSAGQVIREDPAARQRQAGRDQRAAALMRGILRHPQVQALEAAWRAVWMLVRRLDTDNGVKLHLLDTTLPELLAAPDTAKGPWTLIVGNYSFGQSEADAQALARIAGLGVPFVAAAHIDEEPHAAWEQFRHSPAARSVGLALPRFLLRLPYGKETDAIETFPFEEMPESEHAAYLWGNPAFACAYCLATREHTLDGLPLLASGLCTEILMTEGDAQ